MLDKERLLAILILEEIAAKLGKEKIFDKDWYAYEDLVTEIIMQDRKRSSLKRFISGLLRRGSDGR